MDLFEMLASCAVAVVLGAFGGYLWRKVRNPFD